MDVCRAFEQRGVASNCRLDGEQRPPTSLWKDPKESVLFDLPSVAGQRGQVAVFSRDDDYRKTVNGFAAHVDLAGPHRYGVPRALIFTQINSGLPQADGEKVKAALQQLTGDRVEVAPAAPPAPTPQAEAPPEPDAKGQAVRELMAQQLKREMTADGTIKSIWDDEDPHGPVLHLRGERCSQAFVDQLVASKAKVTLRKAGWQRVICHKGMLTSFDANL